MSETKECPFKPGDIVEHKASGERAVVLGAVDVDSGTHYDPGPMEYTGRVALSYGFNQETEERDSLLELIPPVKLWDGIRTTSPLLIPDDEKGIE